MSAMTTSPAPSGLAIRDVAARTGLSVDTLRWYEREGLLPRTPRGRDGRRVYPRPLVELVELVVALRRTGLPVADTRTFVELAEEGPASHGRRMALLERHREAIHEQQRQLAADLAAVESKVQHYRDLIAEGRDCDGLPVDPATAARQRRTS